MPKYQDPLVVAPSNGVTPGDDRSYPNRGTQSGFIGSGSACGADVSLKAKNVRGSAFDASDPMMQWMPPAAEKLSGSSRSGVSCLGNGRSITGATGSDMWDDTTPGDENDPSDRD